VVRSPVAFGRIVSIDTIEARRLPGVVAIWTFDDVKEIPPIDIRLTKVGGLEPYRQTVLARDYVRYVGDPVAAVFAESAYIAEDAAELVVCAIEDLPACVSALSEPGDFTPGTLPGVSTEAAVFTKAYGDIEAAYVKAHAVVELEVAVGRHTAVPLETRGALAEFDPVSGILCMQGAAKVPHYNRDQVARMLDMPNDMVHLIQGHVGGGFGVRGELYPEDVLVCQAALRLKRPVKWVEDRHEHLLAANHSRDQVHRLRAAVDERGYILALEDDIYADQGGYIRTHGVTVADLAAAMLPGPYVVPAYRATAHVRLTNKTPAGTYRAPGRYESSFARERLLDAIARKLGRDPIDVRRINLIPKTSMPFDRCVDTLGTRVVYDSGDYALLLDKLLAYLKYDSLKAELAARRAAGEKVGLGLAFFVEKSGLGPADKALISIDADGMVEVVTGAASVGQGIETVMAQICAETLDIPMERIRVVHGRTDRIDYGMGAFASRVTVMTGCAVKAAAEALRDKLYALPLGTPPGTALAAEGWFRADHMTYPYGIHAAVVRVDADTCGITVERYVVACDIGRAVNPMLVEGQFAGGAVQGIGGALYEEFVYDEAGQPLATTFADYLMPTVAEVPTIEMLVTEDAPSPQNPLGVKGAGEGGINAAGAAIAAAVDEALSHAGAVTRLPITPLRLHRMHARSA
jgi:carbon-monoxide dehydrogenase large subunit